MSNAYIDSRIFVDSRWKGHHGIARYSEEVLPRLSVGFTNFRSQGNPASPSDAFSGLIPSFGKNIYTPGFNAQPLAKRNLITVHDLIHLQIPDKKQKLYKNYYDFIVKPTIKKCGIVITDSHASVKALAMWLGDDSVEIINASVGCPEFVKGDRSDAQRVENKLFVVGSMKPHKNLSVILKSLVKLAEFEASILVPKQDLTKTRDLVKESNLGDRVTILSSLSDDELLYEYDTASLTIFPSILEGFGLPALESIARGTPVLYSEKCESVAEIVGESGFSVSDASNVDLWAETVRHSINQQIIISPEIVGKYSWENTAKTVESTIRKTFE